MRKRHSPNPKEKEQKVPAAASNGTSAQVTQEIKMTGCLTLYNKQHHALFNLYLMVVCMFILAITVYF